MAELIQGTLSFATEGEQKAAKCLRALPDQWIVVCNKILPASNGRSFEIDFIIIADNWVFLLDEKAWRGPIRGGEDYWVRTDGSSEKSPLAKIDYVARIVKGRLDWRLSLLKHEGHFVRGGVLFSSQTALPQIHDTRARDGLFLLETVCERLQQLDKQGGTPLIGQYRREVTRAFIGFDDRPKMPKQIDNYIIKESVMQRPNVRVMRAVEEGEESVQRQLIVYNCGQDPLETSSLRSFYMQECKALRKLSATGLVPQVQDPRPWSDDFLVLPIELPSGESLNAYPLPETAAEFQQELMLVKACFEGLSRIHHQGVLHRAIGPDAIYVQRGQPPRVTFTNFYAARLGTQTIAAALDELEIEDSYASGELILGYGAATERTDTFSLALVLLQRLSAVSIGDIRTSIDSSIIFPDHPRWSEFLSMQQANELGQLFKAVLIPAKDETPPNAQQIAQRVDVLMQHMQSSTRIVEGQSLMKGRFRVHRLLGEGAMARTYLVSMSAYEGLGLHVLKQFIRPSDVQRQAFDEYRALQTMKSIYFPTIEDIYLPEDDAHIKMEYIPGPTLQQVEGELPWSLERWWSFARDLLSALEQLEDRHLLHRDIKPANIILHEQDNHPVLIDFGFAVQQGTTTRVAGTPLYLPPEAVTAKEPPASCDRYAVGVVLFKTLTGLIPFKNLGSRRQLIEVEGISDEKVRRIATIILRALASDARLRPESAHEMYEELQRAMLALEAPLAAVATQQELPLQEQHNTWVDGIRSVYRNSETGNMDNRGLDSEFVKQTYVQTALDLSLLPAIIERKPTVIFLAGNPGDGKTAFLAKVQAELQARGAARIDAHCNSSGWEWIYQGHIFRSCYDASESFGGMSADEQLIEKLRGLEGYPSSGVNLTVLVAINDGRLVSFLTQQAERFPWLVQEQEQASRANDLYTTAVWSIDLKKRAFVSMPDKEHSLFRQVLQRFVDAPHWETCQKCVAKTICPILSNATELRQARRQNRLEYLFLYTHLRQQRHITMRDLRSTLSYLITGNRSCEQVHESRRGEDRGASLLTQSYWQLAFDHVPEGDELLADIASLDPARFPQPHLDRFLHFHQQSSESELRQQLFADNADLPMQRFVSEHEWIDAFKRRLYFTIRKMTRQDGVRVNPMLPRLRWSDLLPYQYAIAYVGLLDGREDRASYLQQLALGILRAQKVTNDVPRLRDSLNVVVQSSDAQQLVVLKQLPLADFELQVIDTPRQSVVETLPQGLRLVHRERGTPRLDIHLDLFELLMRLAHGFLPNAPEYQSLLNDLEPFKGALLLQEADDLVLIENQYRVHHITQTNGKIVRAVLS